MAFLSGSLGFERFAVSGFKAKQFGQDQIDVLSSHLCGKFDSSDTELVQVGFLGGAHLFDQDFDLEKNLINDALHFAIRIDSNQIPSAIKKAWMQMELAGICKDNDSGRPTKSQRQEAKEAVEARCEAEASTGKYRKMKQIPVLWDHQSSSIYLGGSGGAVVQAFSKLFEVAFEVELSPISAGSIATQFADKIKKRDVLEELAPAAFVPQHANSGITWSNADAANFDFLGNEFLMWLWWTLDNQSDSIKLADKSNVTVMLNKTLALECPLGENGKETFSSEAPVRLPEAMLAIQSGKLPRKSGMTLIRDTYEFNLVLQAETFALSSASIKVEEDDEDEQYRLENRIESIRFMSDTVDQLFQAFCELRLGKGWNKELSQIQQWLKSSSKSKKSAA